MNGYIKIHFTTFCCNEAGAEAVTDIFNSKPMIHVIRHDFRMIQRVSCSSVEKITFDLLYRGIYMPMSHIYLFD